jgi:hypothetical protein
MLFQQMRRCCEGFRAALLAHLLNSIACVLSVLTPAAKKERTYLAPVAQECRAAIPAPEASAIDPLAWEEWLSLWLAEGTPENSESRVYVAVFFVSPSHA